MYIGSADLMPRNLYNRVELVTPVEDPRIRAQLLDLLDRCLADNTNAWVLGPDGTWTRRRPDGEPRNVQRELIELHETRAAGPLSLSALETPRLARLARRSRVSVAQAHGPWLVAGGGRARPGAPPLEEDLAADVVVVGGGYTGMWTAWFVASSSREARVVLLEADRCGAGPSGRNGGFVNAMWFGLPALRRRFGDEPALGSHGQHRRRSRGSDAGARNSGWTPGTAPAATFRSPRLRPTTAPGRRSPTPARSWASRAPASRCSEAEVRARCDSPLFRAGAFYPAAATVQPARLALGLRARLQQRGVPSSRARGSGA